MDKWIAVHSIEPFGDDWYQTGTIAATIENGLQRIEAILLEVKAKPEDRTKPEDFFPYGSPDQSTQKPTGPQRMSPLESERMMRIKIGV